MVKREQEFEEGKPMEEYADDSKLVDELNNLKIDPEPNPDAGQRLETVVEEPVRNEKAKKKPEPPVVKIPEQSAPKVVEEPKIEEPPPVEQPVISDPVQEALVQQQVQPEQLQFNGIDDYIKKTGKAVGQAAEANFVNGAYNNLLGVIRGEFVIVPRQAVEQAPQQKPVESEQPKPITLDDLRVVVKEVVAAELPKAMPVQTTQAANPKAVKGGRWSLKMTGAAVAVFLAVGVIIILTINALH